MARQELHGRLFWRAVKRCDGDSDASVRGVGEGATRYHAGGDGELRFVKMVFMDGLLPGSVQGLDRHIGVVLSWSFVVLAKNPCSLVRLASVCKDKKRC